ncbi:MAG: LytTR family transcriptional regulator [Bacteroidales bacterium]|nr:LytTR family transcriptional regulator [Bacteroidales bacterium]
MAFILLYKPAGIIHFFDMGKGALSFNVSITTCIIFGVLILTRIAFFTLRRVMKLNWDLYVTWCVGELFLCSAFLSLYFVLRYRGTIPYFDVLGVCMAIVFSTIIYPFAVLTMGLALNKSGMRAAAEQDDLIRFQDENKRVKLVIATSAVLFISARENYVQIYYMDGERIKDYVLRTSMKGIEELITKHGLVRSHRSYFVNPTHIEVLRKDREGQTVALLDVPAYAAGTSTGINTSEGSVSIPVSKRYADALTSMLG